MEIEEALATHLATAAGITALAATRIYPNVIPQGQEGTSLAYTRLNSPRDRSHDGATRLSWPRFELTCQAATYAGAKALATAVRQALRDYRGLMGGTDGILVQAAFIEDDQDDYVEESRTHLVRMDVTLWHAEQ